MFSEASEGQGPKTGPGGLSVNIVGARGHNHAHEGLEIEFRGRRLKLVLSMGEDDIAPLFDGAAWAGTQLWDAAILMVRYVGEHHLQQLSGGARLLELGCGTGVPGMCCRIMGGRVTLTEQPQLVPLLQQNVAANFPGDDMIGAKELSWSAAAAGKVHEEDGPFDILLASDCVFPPVYGESWVLLVDAFHELLLRGSGGVALISWEQRKGDKMEEFLAYCATKTPPVKLNRVLWEDPVGIYAVTLG